MSFKNLLIPLDGSPLAEKALSYIESIADPGANLHFLSLVTEDKGLLTTMAMAGANGNFVYDNMAIGPSVPHLINERENYLKDITKPLRDKGYKIVIDARRGEVVQSIVELARDGYDAILMVTHGRTGLSKALLGSVAESVVVKSPCPIVLIPAHAPDNLSASP